MQKTKTFVSNETQRFWDRTRLAAEQSSGGLRADEVFGTTEVSRDIATTIFDPASVFLNHIDEVTNPASQHCFYKLSRNCHPSQPVTTTPLETVTCKVFCREPRQNCFFSRDYVGGGRRTGGSAARGGAGGRDNSGLSKACLRVRACCDVAPANVVCYLASEGEHISDNGSFLCFLVLVVLSSCFTVPYPCKACKITSHQRNSKTGFFVHTSLTTTLHNSLSQNRVF